MKLLTILPLLLLTQIHLNAQQPTYDLDRVPAEVKKGASSILRSETSEFEVSDIDRARLHVHQVVTALNETAKDALSFQLVTDKYRLLEDVDIKVYDQMGKILSKYKERDIPSFKGVLEFIDDFKLYDLTIQVHSFPVTVVLDYSLKYKGTLTYPGYEIQVADEGVENSSFTARIKKELGLRYLEKNIHLAPSLTDSGNYTVYTWAVKNLMPIKSESNTVSYESRYPAIILAPNKFKLDEYEGDMTSWKNFGLWYAGLIAGGKMLSEERKQFFLELVKTATSDRQKEEIIYAYLQKNFRYVSIQLGIGGFKPLSADFTDSRKYGDCKGLSNYMQAALSAVGIKSYLALINATYNKEPVDPAFPCNQFNHAIICIPGNKDTTWLECTSKSTDFGSLGSFTENRNALLITENGGVLVPTPSSQSSSNIIRAYTTIDLKDDGSGASTTHFATWGEYKQEMIGLKEEKTDDQKSYLVDRFGFKDPGEIIFDSLVKGREFDFVVAQQLERIPELQTGDKMFLPLTVFDLCNSKLPNDGNRQADLYFKCPYLKIDTTVINLPKDYGVEALPPPETDSCTYASYTFRCWYDNKTHRIYSVATIMLNQHKIPVSYYSTLKKFFDGTVQEKTDRIVLKKL